jgi:hypothetical protein
MLKRIHVNQHIIRANSKDPTDVRPPLSVKAGGRTMPAMHVEILGASTVVYSPSKPLPCGARVWIETSAPVIAHRREHVMRLE